MTANPAASARARLTTLARTRGEDVQRLLVEYGNERLLCRLSRSPHTCSFVLKGATLFAVWTGRSHRATKDIDLLGFGDPSVARLEAVFREVAAIEIPEDGVVFDPDTVATAPIREDSEYGGTRITLEGHLAGARLHLQVDVGFGDAVTPPAELAQVPCLLPGLPSTSLRAYPREVAIAEKYAAMVLLGPVNSRLKDFYDIWVLAGSFDFEGDRLDAAIRATFARRGVPMPTEPPLALTPAFAALEGKEAQWRGFARRAGLLDVPELGEVLRVIAVFLSNAEPSARWHSGAGWERASED